MAANNVLLLTGPPGVGKTTVLRRLAAALQGRRLGGFYTEELRMAGERVGFRIAGFTGLEKLMAHVDFSGGPRIGKYGVDVSAIDALAASALAHDKGIDTYLVDEIGKMECLSERFVRAMHALLASGAPVVATVALKGGGFIAEVKRLPGVELWEVTHENRDALPQRIAAWLSAES